MEEKFGTIIQSVNVVGSELPLGSITHNFGKHSKGHM
jgi:hypothetical protein